MANSDAQPNSESSDSQAIVSEPIKLANELDHRMRDPLLTLIIMTPYFCGLKGFDS